MSHRWHFFRAGGVDQVSLRDGKDLHALTELDQKLWVALAMPVKGVDIDPATLSGDKIIFGATVTLLDEDDKAQTFQIVSPYEADAKLGRISYNSPLGKALIGRKVEEEVEVTVPSGDRFYVVEKIEFI